MKESDRLTTATYKHMTDKYKTATKKWEVSFQKVYDQLFAYEDTGLSPEEVEKLKDKVYSTDEVNHLIAELDTVVQNLKAENAELRERFGRTVDGDRI